MTASREDPSRMSQNVSRFTEDTSRFVADIVSRVSNRSPRSSKSHTNVTQKQQQNLEKLRERTNQVAQGTAEIEATVAGKGLPVDRSAKEAIARGAEIAKEGAKAVLDSATTYTK